jgi:SPP1 family predicted phage head-tail adaptor
MQAGRLRHFITIQALVSEQDAVTGEITPTWVAFANVWADVRPASAREFLEAGIQQAKVMTAVKIRYVSGVKQSMRILHGDQVFNIEGILRDPKSGREWLTLPCSDVTQG